MKEWLNQYWLKPSPLHFIRYCIPRKTTKKGSKSKKMKSKSAELKKSKDSSDK